MILIHYLNICVVDIVRLDRRRRDYETTEFVITMDDGCVLVVDIQL